MPKKSLFSPETLPSDLKAGLIVFLVALPLCLGVAHVCKAPLFAGVLSGIIGGIVVGILSKSHTSVSGPSPGLAAVVAAQIAQLDSFEGFLLATVLAGGMQIALGLARTGFVAAFFPSSVINGLLVAIGVILILKQAPHVVGHDQDPDGEMAFLQPDNRNTFTALLDILGDFCLPAAGIGLASIAVLLFFDKNPRMKASGIPAQLVVVVLGVVANLFFGKLGATYGEEWELSPSHLVQVPAAEGLRGFVRLFVHPDFGQLANTSVWFAAFAVAVVASLETLLNLEAADKLDPKRRTSPPNRELIAQGIGNIVAGLIGAIPVTSVIVRSSVNINAGARTRLSTIVHGLLMLACVALLPTYLNMIPLASLAAILIVTGFKLANPTTIKRMWNEGSNQFLPFAATVVAIVFTDLLVGILIGLAIAIGFILRSNLRRPLRRIREKHLGDEVLRIKLASQVSFLNRAALAKAFDDVPPNGHVMIDAHNTEYIDPDVLDLILDFRDKTAPARGVRVSMRGFQDRYKIEDQIEFVDYSTRELQSKLTPAQVIQILKDGNQRFLSGRPLHRHTPRIVDATAQGQFPLAAILSCIDSRSPAELVFDLGVGDIFNIRIAGNVAKEKVLGSLEYACAVAGSKLIVVMGHTRCGAVNTTLDLHFAGKTAAEATGCTHIDVLIREIQKSMDGLDLAGKTERTPELADEVMRRNVRRTVASIRTQSPILRKLEQEGTIAIVGASYDVATGAIEFFDGAGGRPAEAQPSVGAVLPKGDD